MAVRLPLVANETRKAMIARMATPQLAEGMLAVSRRLKLEVLFRCAPNQWRLQPAARRAWLVLRALLTWFHRCDCASRRALAIIHR